jgi:ketosteroid isomerase-like protein
MYRTVRPARDSEFVREKMNRLILLVLVTSLILAAGCERCDTTTVSEAGIEQLIATRASLKTAMLDGDIESVDRIYSDDYGLVTRKGVLRTRSERLEMIGSGKLRYLRVGEEAEVSVKTYGNTAVVRGVVGSSETKFDGERREPGPRRFTEIWVYENGQWREVGRQATTIADVGGHVDPALGGRESTDVEKQVWALEDRYMTAFKEAEHDAILDLLHDRFLGWPGTEEKPRNKNEAAEFLRDDYAQPFEGRFDIDRTGFRVLGDVVMTHYVINMSGRDENGVQRTKATRVTHTWIKDGSDWKIVGGMSNAL